MMMKPFIFADNLQLNTPSKYEYEYLKKYYQHVEPKSVYIFIIFFFWFTRNSPSKNWLFISFCRKNNSEIPYRNLLYSISSYLDISNNKSN